MCGIGHGDSEQRLLTAGVEAWELLGRVRDVSLDCRKSRIVQMSRKGGSFGRLMAMARDILMFSFIWGDADVLILECTDVYPIV